MDWYALAREGLDQAAAYGRGVLAGQIPVCELTRLAVERHYRDLETAHERGLVFDENAAGRVIAFFHTFLRHSKGEWAGQPIRLEPWQLWIISCVFGWVHEESGLRRFNTVYEEIPRKNGKTTKLAGIGLYGLTKDNEAGAEVYSAATKRDQARLLFDEAKRMVQQSPPLRKRLEVLRHNMNLAATHSKFEPLSSDANSLDGLNPHMPLVDELHAHKTSEVWDVLKSATGARRQWLLWAITTAGFNRDGICYEVRDYATKVLRGIIEDDSFFAIIYTIDEGDDWKDELSWRKANPNLGVSVKLEYLRDQARAAMEMPRALTNFLTKHLDVWVNAETLWMNIEAWRRCEVVYDLADVEGWDCWGGLDLASVSDICALGFVFRSPESDRKRVWVRCYLPEDTVQHRVQKNQVPYDVWAREGWLTLTPGNVTDYNYIRRDLLELAGRLSPKGIAFDRWNSSQLVNDLLDEGLPMVAYGQGHASMNAPMKELERMVIGGEIEHDGNPVLAWAMSNLVVRENEAGDIKPAKNRSKEKIDPAVAIIMALGLMIGGEGEEEYIESGFVAV